MGTQLTQCPRCGFLGEGSFEECPRCGIFVLKFLRRQQVLSADEPFSTEHPRDTEAESQDRRDPRRNDSTTREEQSHLIREKLSVSNESPVHYVALAGRGAVVLCLLVWGGYFILSSVDSNSAGASFLHLVNLPFHEAGHLLFSPFGKFLRSLGGTLGQLLVPAGCVWVLYFRKDDRFGAAVCLWWLGQNFVDIAPYINDARAGTLPLLGGNTGSIAPYGFHDWQYLLTEIGWLEYDRLLARVSQTLGSLMMILAVTYLVLDVLREFGRRAERLSVPKRGGGVSAPPLSR